MRAIPRSAGFLFLACAIAPGCVDISNLDGFDCSSFCDAVTIGPNSTVLLLGDTVTIRASTILSWSDFTWEHSTSAIEFVGPPVNDSELGASKVIVLGNRTGTSTVTATRKGNSATATVEVIPASELRSLSVQRYCWYTHTGSCAGLPLNPTEQNFRDSLAVGDTALLTPVLSDNAGRSVKATIQWSSSNTNIGGIKYKQYSGYVVGAVSPGDVVIRAAAAGKEASFVLHVYKR
jgi:hypothetical protein